MCCAALCWITNESATLNDDVTTAPGVSVTGMALAVYGTCTVPGVADEPRKTSRPAFKFVSIELPLTSVISETPGARPRTRRYVPLNVCGGKLMRKVRARAGAPNALTGATVTVPAGNWIGPAGPTICKTLAAVNVET